MTEISTLTFQAAFELYQKESAALNDIWKFYMTIALGLLSAVVASDKIKATTTGMAVIVTGFIFFALANMFVVLDVHATMASLAALANQIAELPAHKYSIKLHTSTQFEVGLFHAMADVFFVAAMWLIFKASKKQAKDDTA